VLIDFITAGVDLAQLSAADQAALRDHGERICKLAICSQPLKKVKISVC
jgi:hypothetical protein